MSKKLTMSRRNFLKTMAVGAAVLTPVGNAVASTSSPSFKPMRARRADITIRSSGWPVGPLAQSDIESNAAMAPQKVAVDQWLAANPGVELIKVDLPNDREALMTAIIGGTDATYLLGSKIGSWSLEGTRTAFIQGFLGDCTPLIEEQKLSERVLPHIWSVWSANSAVDGKFFGFPLNQYTPNGSTLIYRKDLAKATGLPEPEIGWTWAEARELLNAMTDKENRFYGAGFPYWMPGFFNDNHGADILTQIPRPDLAWHWERDLTTDPRWVELLEEYQAMVHEDECILSDVALGGGDNEYYDLFHSKTTGFARVNYFKMFAGADTDGSLAGMARREGMEYDELIGVVTMPSGDGYQHGGGVNEYGPVSFSPNDDEATIKAAGDLVNWMFFGGGLDITKGGTWTFTENAQAVWSSFLFMDGRDSFEGVPVTPADAWGQEVVDRWVAIGAMPLEPQRTAYFPAEKNPGPDNQALDDAHTLISAEADVNVAETIANAQANWMQQASGFESSISAEDFAAAANEYYAALGTHLETNYADFYANRYMPFMERISEYLS